MIFWIRVGLLFEIVNPVARISDLVELLVAIRLSMLRDARLERWLGKLHSGMCELSA